MDDTQNDADVEKNISHAIALKFGFTDLSNEQQQKLIEKMTEAVIKRVLVDAYAMLGESERKVLEDMMLDSDAMDINNVEEYIRTHVSDYDALVTEAITDLEKHIAENSRTDA